MRHRAPVLSRFYPIVPTSEWVARLLPLGVRTLQLRLKDAGEHEVPRQIVDSLAACRSAGCQLIVNDYWREAIDADADFVHLGQEDLATADIAALKRAGLRLGVSTHDEAELETALQADPDYIALGPIWETRLKAMKWAPQGLDRIAAWKKRIGALPLVAIGGITIPRADSVLAAGAQSCAVITDFVTASDPDQRVADWVAWSEAVAA